jgi:Lantibiotic dehydratase, N terminus
MTSPVGVAGEHLVRLAPESSFSVWRSVCVRSAGFPYDWLRDDMPPPDTRLAEAICWQHARVADQLRAGVRKKRQRQLDRTLASYRTRYCAKNDSVAFYGPIAWAQWTEGETVIDDFFPPPRGEALLELWAVRTLADVLVARHQLTDWTVPSVAPAVGIGGRQAYLRDGSQLTLSALQCGLMAACDGFRTTAEVVGDCAETGQQPLAAVAAQLRQLQAMGLVTAGFAIAQSPHPERQLRAQLWRVADPGRRAAALRELDELISARDSVTRAAGDPQAVAAALAELGDTFERLTGAAARRRDGEFYAGRTLVYEECVSGRQTLLSLDLLAEVAPVLQALLLSARWLTAETSRRFSAWAGEILTAEAPGPAGLPLTVLLDRARRDLEAGDGPAAQAAAELRRRWTAILLPAAVSGPVLLDPARVLAQAREQFPASAPGWPTARWHGPDLMIAAASADDFKAGNYLAVLGELHVAVNHLDQQNFLTQHPDPVGFRHWIDADMPGRIAPLIPLRDGTANSRTAPPEAYHSPGYTYLGLSAEPSYAPAGATVLPAGALRVHRLDGRLVVRSTIDDFAAGLAQVFDGHLAEATFNKFSLLRQLPHQPRIQVGKTVVTRETWRIPFAEFAELDAARLPRIMAEMQRVREQHGLPNPVFCVVSGEPKPVYLDFTQPAIVDMVWHKLRRGRQRQPDGQVTVTEMLPGPGQLWLRDEAGRRYTAEFRMVCVDAAEYQETGTDRDRPTADLF